MEQHFDVVVEQVNNEINAIIEGMLSPGCDVGFTDNESVAVYFKHLPGYHVAFIPYHDKKYTIHKIY